MPGQGRFPLQLSVPKARFLLKEGDAQEKITLFPPSRKLMFLRFLPQPLLPHSPLRIPSPLWGRDMEQCGGPGVGGHRTNIIRKGKEEKQTEQPGLALNRYSSNTKAVLG